MPENIVFKIYAFHDFLKIQELASEKTARYSGMFRAAYKLLVSNLGLSSCPGYSLKCDTGDVKNLKSLAQKLKKHFFWGCKVELRYLLMKQLFYDCSLFKYNLSEDDKIFILRELFLKKESSITDSSFEQLLSQVDAWGANQECSAHWNAFLEKETKYDGYGVFDVAVCATMSAGKSTFVNALLGNDVLPARNEATTAKITTVIDKDGLGKVYGFCGKKGKVTAVSDDVDYSLLDSWNSSEKVDRVFLQADLDRIANKNIVVTIHDTPGTNNSGDVSHHDMTVSFLKKQKIDAVIYVSSAEQLATCDEFGLLNELYGLTKKKKTPVIFILNKIDSLDLEKEKLSDFIAIYRSMLKNVGFDESASIIPVSSRQARLIKMLQKEKSLTRKEMRECKSMMLDLLPDENTDILWAENVDLSLKRAILEKAYALTGFMQIENVIETIACKEGI